MRIVYELNFQSEYNIHTLYICVSDVTLCLIPYQYRVLPVFLRERFCILSVKISYTVHFSEIFSIVQFNLNDNLEYRQNPHFTQIYTITVKYTMNLYVKKGVVIRVVK